LTEAEKRYATTESQMKILKNTVVDIGISLGNDLLPYVNQAMSGLSDMLSGKEGGAEKVAEAAKGLITTLMNGIVNALPDVINIGFTILDSLVKGLTGNDDKIVEGIVLLVDSFAKFINENLEPIVKSGLKLLLALAEAVIDNAPELIDTALVCIESLIEGLIDGLPKLIPAAIDMVVKIADSISEHLSPILTAAIDLVVALTKELLTPDNIMKLAEAAVKILTALATALIDNLGYLLVSVWELIQGLVTEFGKKENLQKMGEAGKELISSMMNSIVESVKGFGDTIASAVRSLFSGEQITVPITADVSTKKQAPTASVASMYGIPTYYNYKQFATGTAYVPETGLYTLHRGESVIPAAATSNNSNYTLNVNGASNPDQVAGIVVQRFRMAGAI
jgi:phage-related protein